MTIIEPPSVFLDRVEQLQIQNELERKKFWEGVETPKEHPDGWDHVIMDFFRRRPKEVVLYMTAVNILAKQSRARTKRDRERAKLILIRSIGRLIKAGRLQRVRRRFVQVNGAEIPSEPLIHSGAARHITCPTSWRDRLGSTRGRTEIHPSIFV